MIKIKNLNYSINNEDILKDISFDIKEFNFIGIVGPNGSGKTTLVKNLYQSLKADGNIFLKGKSIKYIDKKTLAKTLAVLSQNSTNSINYTIEDVILMGRYPHKNMFLDYSYKDKEIVNDIIKKLKLEDIKTKSFSNLSGGEQQRVLIARALAQQAEVIILDEPTNHLDINYQLEIMELLKKLKITTITTIHDMNIASRYCDKIVALKDGALYNKGAPKEVFSTKFFKEVFKVNVSLNNIEDDKLAISFLSTLE